MRLHPIPLAILSAVWLAFGLASCQHPTPAAVETPLTDWVREAIEADPRVAGAEMVAVHHRDGIVTLTGRVPTLAARRYAVLQAQQVHGVRGVIDRLEVRAGTLSDEQVRAAVERRLQASLTDPDARVFVSSEQGHVSLEGDVATWAEVQEAGLVASQVPGVRDVTNHLAARGGSVRSDRALEERIEKSFGRDALLAHLPLRATVADGAVRVSGDVDSAYERERALRRARSLTPDGIVEDRIRVRQEPVPLETQAPTPAGQELVATVETELALDPRLRGASIEVDVDGRLITLSGRVRNLSQKRIAGEDARNVAGVAWVANDLGAPRASRSDDELMSEILAGFAVVSQLSEVTVEVEDGTVTLGGVAPNWAARGQAGVLAASVAGVADVRNEARVPVDTSLADEDIAAQVETHLQRNASTARVAERIAVTVDRGFVQLGGDVDTWGQWLMAERLARRTPGSRGVANQLAVDPYPFALSAPHDNDRGPLEYDPPHPPQP